MGQMDQVDQADQADDAARTTLEQLIDGYADTQYVALAAQLGIADLLADGPLSADALATATNSHPDALYRALRAMAARGLFAESDGRQFALTPLSEFLRSTHPDSMRGMAIRHGGSWYRAYGDLPYSVATGKNAFRHVHGRSLFEYLAEHPDEGEMFNQAMTANAKKAVPAVLAAYDFSWAQTVVDVAGGQGLLLSAMLQAHPTMHGVLFDLPHVVARAEPLLQEAGVADRCEVVGGDFFEGLPAGGDLYTLRWIIHDWEDEPAATILHNCARAMHPQGKVALIEMVLGESNSEELAPLMDLDMLLIPGGRERTAEEYERLLTTAGLRLTRIVPTQGYACVIEAEHAQA
jgi:O-methyltransferase domain/Dimerisation domain